MWAVPRAAAAGRGPGPCGAGPWRQAASCRGRVLLGQWCGLLAVRDHGLAEAESEVAKLPCLLGREIGVALGHVLEGVIHPFALLLFGGLEDAATVDMAEELVASAVEERCLVCLSSQNSSFWTGCRSGSRVAG